MQLPTSSLGKRERQRLVGSLVARKRIGTQLELRDALAAAGCLVTQATISRDIRELGLEKTKDDLGRPRYVIPQRARSVDPRAALGGVLRQFASRATAAENLVVVVSELGTAPAIARALDRIEHALVVGTVAGDDTVLVITRNAGEARSLADELTDLIG
jgi:transcriptional regulator of arginine metabolism